MARLLAERFAAWGCTPHPVHYAYSEASIARLVAEGLGIAVVAETDGVFGCPVWRLRPAWLIGRPWCWSGRKSGKRTNPGRLWQQTTAGRDLFLFCFSPSRSHRPGPC